mmetsp:Transcript_16907/g.41186  ORF Transcript_16907/g.41186 Transcript_16907/m.41186 type:complete len:157 (+) Transcript_16907:671-1141(+)
MRSCWLFVSTTFSDIYGSPILSDCYVCSSWHFLKLCKLLLLRLMRYDESTFASYSCGAQFSRKFHNLRNVSFSLAAYNAFPVEVNSTIWTQTAFPRFEAGKAVQDVIVFLDSKNGRSDKISKATSQRQTTSDKLQYFRILHRQDNTRQGKARKFLL